MSDDRPRSRSNLASDPVRERSSPRVLILEDEVLIAIDLQETLREAGLDDIVICHRLDEANAASESQNFDLAFLDHMIGLFSSVDVGNRLAEKSTQVVFLSGSSRGEVSNLPRNSVYLQKPYSEQQILSVVESVISDEKIGQPEKP